MRNARFGLPARIARSAAGVFLFAAAACAAGKPAELAVPASEVLATVNARYSAVTNLSLTVRRQIPGQPSELVSRVTFARGGRLVSETLSPQWRKVVVDGESAWSLSEGGKKPVRVAFGDQTEAQKASVLCVPGSPEEALTKLDAVSATDVPEPAAPHARQIVFGIRGKGPESTARAVVSFDARGLVRAVDVFSDEALRWRVSSISWEAPREVLPGVWLFGRSVSETAVDGVPIRLVTRFDGFRANEDVDPAVFDPSSAFENGSAAAAPAPRRGPRTGGALAGGFSKAVVGFYRTAIAPAIGQRCALEPSCSRYFLLATRKHGWLGIPMTADRFVREPVASAPDRPVVRGIAGDWRHPDPVEDHDWWFAK